MPKRRSRGFREFFIDRVTELGCDAEVRGESAEGAATVFVTFAVSRKFGSGRVMRQTFRHTPVGDEAYARHLAEHAVLALQ